MKRASSGFTLIELLVVIAIIGTLASVILPKLGDARKKAADSKRINDVQQIETALQLYYDDHGTYPPNHNHWDTGSGTHSECDPHIGGSCNRAACDAPVADVPGGGEGDPLIYLDASMVAPDYYNKTMQELVDGGYMGSIPHSDGKIGYCYDSGAAAVPRRMMVVTELENSTPTTTGIAPSCRFGNAGDVNWCTPKSSQEYCLCNDY